MHSVAATPTSWAYASPGVSDSFAFAAPPLWQPPLAQLAAKRGSMSAENEAGAAPQTQLPAVHCSPTLQAMVHVPQCRSSLMVSTHVPPHGVSASHVPVHLL